MKIAQYCAAVCALYIGRQAVYLIRCHYIGHINGNIIGPAAKWILIVAVTAGVLSGAWVAFSSYIKSIIANINPYQYYVDKSKNKQEFAKHKSYFFGPGLAQLGKTIKDAWGGIVVALKKIADIRDNIGDWSDGFLRFILKPIAWIFYIVAMIAVGLFGGVITTVLSAVQWSYLWLLHLG